MNSEVVIEKTKNAAKLSMIAELLAKIIVPVINMILARILAPEAFGVIATINMITTFTDIFTEAGFQKYLIQQDFSDDEKFYKYANVSFITNFILSIILWLVISIFNKPIATVLGNKEIGLAIIIAMFQLPITSFSSIQTAIYKRKLEFKTLLQSRLLIAITPLIVTVPLALLGLDYWSLIIGNLSAKGLSAILLTVKSEWKPKIFFDFNILKDMFSKSMTLMIETISKWFCDFFDILIIGTAISAYYLGLYKNSYQMVNSILTLFTTALIPVLLSSLSRLNKDEKEFQKMYLFIQKFLAYILLPLGVGVALFRKLATNILFGSNWGEAANIVGIVAITMAIKLIFVDTANTAFIAKGKPKLCVYVNLIYLLVLIPVSIYSVSKGFWTFTYVKNIFVIWYIIVGFIMLYKYRIIKINYILKNIIKPIVCTGIMGIIAIMLKKLFSDEIIQNIIIIVLSAISYFVIMYIIDKKFMIKMIDFLKNRKNIDNKFKENV